MPGGLRSITVVGNLMEPVLRANDTLVYLPINWLGDDGLFFFKGKFIQLLPKTPRRSPAIDK